jgi:IclR family transcriptional regulator, mhp operon transcriptional activator
MDNRQEVKSLKKALRTLVFLNQHGEATVSHVAKAIGVPRPTSYRILETLAAEGYVEKQRHSDVYRLTSTVRQLSSGFSELDMVIEVAKPLIESFGKENVWPVALATPNGSDMVVRVATDHDTSLAIDRFMIGFTTPILYAPSGFCYLAYCDDKEREAILNYARQNGPSALARRNSERLAFMLNQVRTKGYCNIRFPEYREGGVAVPLHASGKIVGSIVMRYIKSTLNASQIQDIYAPAMAKLSLDIAIAYDARTGRLTPAGDPGLKLGCAAAV